MKTSTVIALLTVMLGASLFSLSGSAQIAQGSLANIRTPVDACMEVIPPWWCDMDIRTPVDPCTEVIPPRWCFPIIHSNPGANQCVCPDVVIPQNLGENETIVIKTIPGRVSDTLEISKELNPQPLPPGEGNITLNR